MKMMTPQEFGEFVAKQRKQVNKTQAKLAEDVGIATGSIGKIEIGDSMPSFESFIGLSLGLGMTPGELMNILAGYPEGYIPNRIDLPPELTNEDIAIIKQLVQNWSSLRKTLTANVNAKHDLEAAIEGLQKEADENRLKRGG